MFWNDLAIHATILLYVRICGTCGYQLLQPPIPVPVDFSLWKGYIRWCPALCNGKGRHRQRSLLPASVFMYFPISIWPLLPGKNPHSHDQTSSAVRSRLRLASKQGKNQSLSHLTWLKPSAARIHTFLVQSKSTPECRDCKIFLRL